MRSFLLRVLFLCMPCCAIAQLEDGSFAPDFELQDLNGNTWHLYELLESGKHVILDFSATWCAPCWWYHETGLLNEAYALYGPEGTNELMIFMIEGDDQTNVACLYDLPDCSNTTQGDWTAGTLYPIINDDHIADAYEIEGWPTQFYICPYKLIYNTNQPNLETIDYFLHSCAEPVGQHNASIEAFTSYSGDFCHSISTTPSLVVTNQGHQTIAHATAACYINGELRSTTTWEGHVIPFDTFFLSFPEVTLVEDATVLVRISSVNGVMDDDMSDNDISVQFTSTPSMTQNRLQLELKTNLLPEGVYWEVTNGDSAVLYKGGNPTVIGKEDDGGTYTDRNTVYTISIPLPGDGCYAFSVHDKNGANAGVDYYKITGPAGEVLAQAGNVPFYKRELLNIQQADQPIPNNGAINNIYGVPAAFCSRQAYSFSIDLLNLGEATITEAEIEILENNQRLSFVPWSGEIHPGEQANIAFPALTFDAGKDIVIRIVSVNGSADTYTYQNESTIDLIQHLSEENVISMKIKLDPWAYENYWQLTNSSGDVLYSGGNTKVGPDGGGLKTALSSDPGTYAPGALVKIDFQLPDTHECYTFLLVDSYGNGMYSGSYVTFTEKGTGELIYSKDYTYLLPFDEEEVLFEVDPTTVSIQPISNFEDLLVYPNPVDGALYVSFEVKSTMPLAISVINSLGEMIFTSPEVIYSSGIVNYTIDLPELAAGVYAVRVVSGNEYSTRKIVVTH
ncbi:MAG TPA: T9SS type A sorting domain-containing protein [Saprospiraceae bacterium]|nr:T9SS type A sorting domain-containing protein [Saprospiraceae bacterium]